MVYCFIPSQTASVSLNVVHVTRVWHNRLTSFVSWAYSDMVHHDLSLDNMRWYHKLSFVAGVAFLFEGCPIFSEGIVTQINIVILC